MHLVRLYGAAISLLLAAGLCQSSFGQYYYGGGNKIPLNVDSTKITLKFRDGITKDVRRAVLDSIGGLAPIAAPHDMADNFRAFAFTANRSLDRFIDSVQHVAALAHVEYYYLGSNGEPMTVGDRFCVGFKPETGPLGIAAIAKNLGVEQVCEIEGLPNVWVFRSPAGSERKLLDLANACYRLPEVRYSHPLFGVGAKYCSYRTYDFYRRYQYNIKRVAGRFDTCTFWDYAGLTRPVVVAVLDALVASHEDIPSSRMLSGRDFTHPPEVEEEFEIVPLTEDYHGEACAGIIAASHSTSPADSLDRNTGVISMDPNVKILPVRVFRDAAPAAIDSLAAAITWASSQGADVISCSWICIGVFDVIANAIQQASSYGRNGKGCVVVFSAGNGYQPEEWGLGFPAYLPDVIGVGAIDSLDLVWYYSQRDITLDVVAPSGAVPYAGAFLGDIWSTDLMEGAGGNPNKITGCEVDTNDVDYFCQFGGTSAAAPIVSGAAALLLSRDSTLTAGDVQSIIKNSAERDLKWGTVVPMSNEHIGYGWGLINPFDAMLSITRGDVNNSAGVIDLSDLTALVSYLTGGGFVPFPSVLLGDVNCTGFVDLWDLSYMVSYLTGGGAAPVKPCFEY